MLSNTPVCVIIVGVFINSAPTAFSTRCCCKSNLISSSENPKIFFLAQDTETGAIPSTGITASLYKRTFSFHTSILSKSACVDGFVKPNVKLDNSSSNPNKNKCTIAILFNSAIIEFCILLIVLANLISCNERFLPSPTTSSKPKKALGTLRAVNNFF